ncbi:MAG: hypothetical protein KA313_03260 [Pseudarcicella sp.]|nr:hypothetical protein [Pseudarcicella sp.]MBP6410093.1 hypothetical protein [Pseudarcicella sp.]
MLTNTHSFLFIRTSLLIFIVLGNLACNENKQENQSKKQYFDLKTLIESQTKILEKQKPTIIKTIKTTESKETKETNNIDWKKELIFFRNANINLPSLKDCYKVTQTDSTIDYKLKANSKSKIKHLKIHFYKNKTVKSISILSEDKNSFYTSFKKLSLALINNQIVSYNITGFQKILLGDKKWFTIEGQAKKILSP